VSDRIKLTLSLGIVLLAFSHAWLTAFLVRVPLTAEGRNHELKSFSFDTIEGGIKSIRTVNTAARDELKKQSPICIPCIAQVGSNQPQPQPKPIPVPAVQVKQANNANLDVFVGSDAQSQQLLKWFNSDPDLVRIKQGVNFQAYGPGNSLYKTRYASIIPESAFPAVVFTRPDGGHIHLASRDQIPATAKELYEDLKQSFRLMQSVYSPSPVKQEAEPVSSPDCPDGNCPVPDQANRRPLFPNLRPANPDSGGGLFPSEPTGFDINLIEGILRRSGYSLETVLVIVALVVGVVIYKLR
jgi:hypothetical protein